MAAMAYAVRCPVHVAGPFRTREIAERKRDAIVRLGECRHEHEIISIVSKQRSK